MQATRVSLIVAALTAPFSPRFGTAAAYALSNDIVRLVRSLQWC
jgi:ABC-type spermidine/putrescine transport system permease subunit II